MGIAVTPLRIAFTKTLPVKEALLDKKYAGTQIFVRLSLCYRDACHPHAARATETGGSGAQGDRLAAARGQETIQRA